ncbi:hypothetical protein Aduo_004109 [Ancylostoma duodenale]
MSQRDNTIYADDSRLGNLADVTPNHCANPPEGDKAGVYEVHVLLQEEANKCGSHKLYDKVKIFEKH